MHSRRAAKTTNLAARRNTLLARDFTFANDEDLTPFGGKAAGEAIDRLGDPQLRRVGVERKVLQVNENSHVLGP